MKSFFHDLGFFNYVLLLVIICMCLINVDIYNVTHPPTIKDKQEQYTKDLNKAVEEKREELKRKGLLLYKGGDNR